MRNDMKYRESTCLRLKRGTPPGCTSQHGFTLLEVLIAVVILSVGLLGLAALQATSLKSNHASLTRSQIAILSYDMVDRMRANMPAVRLGDYDLPTSRQNANCTTLSGCIPTEMADHDYFEWTTYRADRAWFVVMAVMATSTMARMRAPTIVLAAPNMSSSCGGMKTVTARLIPRL